MPCRPFASPASWTHTRIVCSIDDTQVLGAATSVQFPLVVWVGTQPSVYRNESGTYPSLPFNYKRIALRPQIVKVVPPTSPTAGGKEITVIGLHLSPQSIVRIGGTLCKPLQSAVRPYFQPCTNPKVGEPADPCQDFRVSGQWQPGTSKLRCETAPGQGQTTLSILGDWLRSEPTDFEYEPPTLLEMLPLSGPTQGGTLVELRGQNFGLETGKVYLISGDYKQTRSSSGDAVFIDGRYLRAHTCAVQSWSDNTIVCKTPPGQGKNRRVHVQSKGVDVLSS